MIRVEPWNLAAERHLSKLLSKVTTVCTNYKQQLIFQTAFEIV